MERVLIALILYVFVKHNISAAQRLPPDTANLPKLDRTKYSPFKIAASGGNVKLLCRLPIDEENQRFYEYKWTKDGKVLTDSTRYRIKRFKFLKIRSVWKGDGGIYKCEVRGEHGVDSLTIKLSIKETAMTKPIIVSPKNNSTIFVKLGESKKVECLVHSQLNIHFQLLRMVRNSASGKYEIKIMDIPTDYLRYLKGTKAIFHFNNISSDDLDVYICMAGNSIGFSTASFALRQSPKSVV